MSVRPGETGYLVDSLFRSLAAGLETTIRMHRIATPQRGGPFTECESKLFARLFATFALTLCMLAAASIVQLLVAHLLPSVAVAFVDVRVFRNWAGLGIREAAAQSLVLACFFVLIHPKRLEIATSARILCSKLVVAVMIWLSVWLAIRTPAEVIAYWSVLTSIQVLVGFAAHEFLFSSSLPSAKRPELLRKAPLLATISIAVFVVVAGVIYSYPTPRPSYSFEVAVDEAHSVTVDAFVPDRVDHGQAPAVVILHGVEGATPLSRLLVHYPNAQAISSNGFATFLVRYFGASPYDDLMLKKGDVLDTQAIEEIRVRDYERWIDAACQSISEIRKQPAVDPDRIAVIGYSLGCYVGTAATSRLCDQGYPCAMVGNFGAVWPEVEFDSSFPPTQFHHGAEDEVIPVEEVQAAVVRLQDCGVPQVELFVYPKQGHVPKGPGSYDIRLSTERFLREQFADEVE